MADTVERMITHEHRHHITARTLSIIAAVIVDAGLFWVFYFRAHSNPPFADIETFWVYVLATFGVYVLLQQWTLANQTGRGDDLSAALDKFFAISPLALVAVLEAIGLARPLLASYHGAITCSASCGPRSHSPISSRPISPISGCEPDPSTLPITAIKKASYSALIALRMALAVVTQVASR